MNACYSAVALHPRPGWTALSDAALFPNYFGQTCFHKRGITMALTESAVIVSACRTANDFKCANNLCLPNIVKCDGYNQCGDGSDESQLCGAFVVFTGYILSVFSSQFCLQNRLSVRPFVV